MASPFSTVADLIEHPRDVADRARPTPWGLCVHTTGRGITQQAAGLGVDSLAHAIEAYMVPDDPGRGRFTNFPHYVIGHTGMVVQLASDRERARHAGISAEDRVLYLSGAWKSRVSASALNRWQTRWPDKSSPLYLYPSRSPNEDYLGCELVPTLKADSRGSLFTAAQYGALAALIADIEQRYSIKLAGQRLVGHEDLEPLARWNTAGGWDPGALRAKPYFSWARLSSATS